MKDTIKKTTRLIKLQPKFMPRKYGSKNAPWLNLAGNWLEDAGFDIGEYCRIQVSKNKLVITKFNN